eukprot:4154273-Heterocapsa_arctica.AAC.1
MTKKVKTDETNKGAKRGSIDKFFSAPSQLGYLPENIPLSQKNSLTIQEYPNTPAQHYPSSSSYDNPDGLILRSDNPDTFLYPASSRSDHPDGYPAK